MPDPRRPLRKGEVVVTVFEVRVTGELNGAMRTVLTNQFLKTVSKIAALPAIVIGSQETFGPEDQAP